MARATFFSIGVDCTPSSHRSISTASTPSGVARTTSGSGVAKRALSRASASVAAITSGSSEPAHANPTWLPAPSPSPTTMRMPTPEESAEVSDSTSPS